MVPHGFDDPLRLAGEVVLGIAVGFFGGLFGISGGAISITALGLLGLSQQLAQGTSLVMQVPNVALAIRQYARRGNIDRRNAIVLIVSSLPFTAAGALLATHLPSGLLRRCFVGFLITMASYTLWNAIKRPSGAARLTFIPTYAVLLGAAGGFLTGLFGLGGAVLATATLVLVFGFSQTAAQGMGLVLALPGVIVGLATYAVARDVDWPAGLALAFGGTLLVGTGVALAHRLPERALRAGFCVVIYCVAAILWFRT